MSYLSTLPSAASFYVSSIPSLQNSSSILVYAGNLPARPPKTLHDKEPEDDAHLYFLLEKARHLGGGPGGKRRLLLWFNGGPGCSSFDGVMMEIGSFRPSSTAKATLEWTTPGGAWNEYTDVLFLDQPVGTGFSYVNTDGYTHTLEQAAMDVNFFMKRFLEVFPEYKKESGTEFYIAGESFAGQYIPYTAHEILSDKDSHLDLQGIVIGNGAIDPMSQAGSELDMMLQSGLWKETDAKTVKIKERNKLCEEEKKKVPTGKHPQDIPVCEGLLRNIIDESLDHTSGETRCINIYDVRLTDTHPACGMNWPPTLQATYDYLARDDVLAAFHVNKGKHPQAWIECNHRVSGGLRAAKSEASVVLLPGILEKGVRVMLFAGDQDLICNHIGIERLIDNLKWGGQKGWGSTAAPKRSWRVNNAHAGYWQSARGLTYVNIANASHMVGFDKPVEAHDMMLRFMGVDLLGAAGPSALIQSSLEGETERKIIVAGGGSANGGGGLLSGIIGGGSTSEDHRPMVVGADEKTEEEVAEQAKWAAYYNAGSAALIVILVLVTVGTCILLRLRRQARRHRYPLSPHSVASPRLNGGSGVKSDQEMELERLVEEGEAAEDDDYDDYQARNDVEGKRRGGGSGGGGGSGKHVTFEDRHGSKGKSKGKDKEKDSNSNINKVGGSSSLARTPTTATGAGSGTTGGPSPLYRHRSGHRPDADAEQLFDVGEDEDADSGGEGGQEDGQATTPRGR